MKLMTCIKKRYSSRAYKDLEVKRKDIISILEAARLAPSAANRQNWYFIVLKGKGKMKVVDLMESYLMKIEKRIKSKDHATTEYDPSESVIESIKVMRQAGVLILAFRKNDRSWLEGDYLSMGAAVEHMVLRATDLGLGSLWVRDVIYLRKEITDMFSLEGMELVTGLVIGYPKKEPWRAKKKKMEDIAKFEK